MSATTSLSPNLPFLAVYSRKLTLLLTSAKSGESSSIHHKVEKAIDELLKGLSMDQSLYIKEALASVLNKIERTLEEFIKLDAVNATRYKALVDKVRGFKSVRQSPTHVHSSHNPASAFEGLARDTQPEPEPLYQNLSDIEKRCLVWFCLLPDGTGLSERDLRYWWVGMGLIDDNNPEYFADGKKRCNEILNKHVAEDFIERAIRDKKAFNVYRMRSGVRSKVMVQAVNQHWPRKVAKYEEAYTALTQLDDETERVPDHLWIRNRIQALLNISGNNLGAKRFDDFSKMKQVKVLDLGTRRHEGDSRDYVVVEDEVELGNALKNLREVTCLSLHGVSGIVQLPNSVCSLKKLRILDLRACNNLEILPRGMNSLHFLTHLDLSECYLLDHVPEAIASLSELRVLKGFIVNPDPDHVKGANGRHAAGVSSCEFSKLKELSKLVKLTIRTRKMNFPTTSDIQTLCSLSELNNLGIAWVGSSSDAKTSHISGPFPPALKKMELQSVPESIVSQLLGIVSGEQTTFGITKLYIRGGGLNKFSLEKLKFTTVDKVRLRYLPKLRMSWDPFVESFPNMTRLEILGCPNLICFPCDQNGVWER